jgi:hypothetical protein
VAADPSGSFHAMKAMMRQTTGQHRGGGVNSTCKDVSLVRAILWRLKRALS